MSHLRKPILSIRRSCLFGEKWRPSLRRCSSPRVVYCVSRSSGVSGGWESVARQQIYISTLFIGNGCHTYNHDHDDAWPVLHQLWGFAVGRSNPMVVMSQPSYACLLRRGIWMAQTARWGHIHRDRCVVIQGESSLHSPYQARHMYCDRRQKARRAQRTAAGKTLQHFTKSYKL